MGILDIGAGAGEGLETLMTRLRAEEILRMQQGDAAENVRANKAGEALRGQQITQQGESNALARQSLMQTRDEAEQNRQRDDARTAMAQIPGGTEISPETQASALAMKAVPPERFESVGEPSPQAMAMGAPASLAANRINLRPTPSEVQNTEQKRQFDVAEQRRATDDTNGGRPYFTPVSTGEGIVPFNTRTGTFDNAGRKDLRPSASAETDLTRAQSTLYQIGEVSKLFTPERVGPLKGRYQSMQLALVGEVGDSGLAEFQAALATLGNTVINLRTGAQMSEPEAQRILKEIPNMNLPPDVFMGRLGRAQAYFQDWLSKRAKLAYGRTTTDDVSSMVGGTPSALPEAGGIGNGASSGASSGQEFDYVPGKGLVPRQP